MSVSVPNSSVTVGAWVLWQHIDGPLIYWASHTHWLTWRERLLLRLRLRTADQIASARWPHLAAERARLLGTLADANPKDPNHV